MAYKNPEDKKAWRNRYREKHKELHAYWSAVNYDKQTGKTKEQRESEKAKKIHDRLVNVEIPKHVKGAIEEIRRRILKRDGQFICYECKEVMTVSNKRPNINLCKECYKEKSKTWKRPDKERANKIARDRMKTRRETDPQYKLQTTIRRQIGDAIRNYCKAGYQSRTGKIKYLGCTIPELKTFLESKFDKRMTWQNHGKYWHIDHIKPVSLFNLLDESQMIEAFNYQNLQPLRAKDNLIKGNRFYPKHTQTAMILT